MGLDNLCGLPRFSCPAVARTLCINPAPAQARLAH